MCFHARAPVDARNAQLTLARLLRYRTTPGRGLSHTPARCDDLATPEEKVIVAKFFNPCGAATWYAAEFDGEDIFFGFADLGDPTCAEWGYFSLQELESYTNHIGLGIERDRWFEPTAFKNITREL